MKAIVISEKTHTHTKLGYTSIGTKLEEEIYSETVSEVLEIIARYTPVLTWILLAKAIGESTLILRRLKVEEELSKLRKEEPEVIRLAEKLKKDEPLDDIDKWNLKEISEASGWDVEDMKEELINLDKDPSEREERYWQLFNKYYEEAQKFKEQKDYTQAAEKLWGAITALIKVYAAKQRILVSQWRAETLWNVVYKNFREPLKSKFDNLLINGSELHRHFYEEHLPLEAYEKRWDECMKLIDEILKPSPSSVE